jgi:hypothetical protein
MQPKGPSAPKPKFAKSWGLPAKPAQAKPEHVQKLAKALKR